MTLNLLSNSCATSQALWGLLQGPSSALVPYDIVVILFTPPLAVLTPQIAAIIILNSYLLDQFK